MIYSIIATEWRYNMQNAGKPLGCNANFNIPNNQ